jgi:tetratricopeptide (TPR) repeat protein
MQVVEILLNDKKYEEAIILLKFNAEANAQSYHAFFALGITYYLMGNNELARENFEKTLQLDPKNYTALTMLREWLIIIIRFQFRIITDK